MIDFLTYDLKVAAILAVFYMFYRVLLARETFHRVNRVVLLATAVASFVKEEKISVEELKELIDQIESNHD